MNRREFVRRAAAAAAPLVVPASAIGAEGPPPSRRIGLGVIGLGAMGSGHVRGKALGGETCPDGSKGEVVFDTRQGVAARFMVEYREQGVDASALRHWSPL